MAASDHLSPSQFFHGSPYGGPTDTPGPSGVHIGTQVAAREALNARIGHRADGKDWDGSSEYGKTLLAGSDTMQRLRRHATGYSYRVGDGKDHYPADTHLDRKGVPPPGSDTPLDAKPALFPVSITGPMTNTPGTPHEDFKANGMMAGQIKKGNAKRGYYYRNISEDSGSISAVVPSWGHLKDMRP